MGFLRTPSVEEIQVAGRFELLRNALLSDPYAVHLEKPLAFWTVAGDRGLPLAFLGRTLRELLQTPFPDLAATPGIGRKKMWSFVKLLARAVKTDPSDFPTELAPPSADGNSQTAKPLPAEEFNPADVCEVTWSQWRASVLRHGLGSEALGRFAPTLKYLTRVIWRRPLEVYAGMSLAEIRTSKTHGRKRIEAILDVFRGLHSLVASAGVQEHLVLRIAPRWIDAAETWVRRELQSPGIPGDEEFSAHFITPLLNQIRRDGSEQVVRLTEIRLGMHGPVTSVRQMSRSVGLTRARVYQLLNEINDIMVVRWPLGRHLVYQLDSKFRAAARRGEDRPGLEQFRVAVELFYPRLRRGAAGPLERAAPAVPAGSSPPPAGDGDGPAGARGISSSGSRGSGAAVKEGDRPRRSRNRPAG